MADKVTLATLTSFTNDTTAVTQTNANNAAITTAMDNTLSRDGTAPNQMLNPLDMNNNTILNLPSPISPTSPVRLTDVNNLVGGGTITLSSLPAGGTAAQVLAKNSSTNFDASWNSSGTPTAGTIGQVLTKNSNTNYDYSWKTLSTGSSTTFNVKQYGAIGDGVTNDTAAINAAIAAFNSAGGGVLYFPASTYSVPNGGLTTITASGGVWGDPGLISLITANLTTATMFTVQAQQCDFRRLRIRNNANINSAAPSGVGILANLSPAQGGNFEDVVVQGFFDGIDFQYAAGGPLISRFVGENNANSNIRIRNLNNPDQGGWRIFDSYLGGADQGTFYHTNYGLLWESCGNGVVDRCTGQNCDTPLYYNGSGNTVDIFISNCSLEDFWVNAIHVIGVNRVNITNVEIQADNSKVGTNIPIIMHNANFINLNNIICVGNGNVSLVDFTNSCGNINMGNIMFDGTSPVGSGPLPAVNFGNGSNTSQLGSIPFVGTYAGSPFHGLAIGARAIITDSTSVTVGQRVAGGGTNTVPAFWNNDWYVG